ncbi:major facilitator superfamily permease [Salinisphaera sp. PC39]|uniref:AmpG family muropeptide MFS transporter n=1 Tax=Salinisphaera sp. PC39 TaxID=1304156 RepID=UPI003341F2F1
MTATGEHGWREALVVYGRGRVLGMGFLGFSAGLPFLLVFSTLSAWLTEVDVSRATIGFFSWVGITYSIKFFWAPVIDRLPLPLLTRIFGRRRSWILLAQVGLAAGLTGMALTDPRTELATLAGFALLVAFSSATQDVSIDAWRIEAVPEEWQGAMAATYQAGYRAALLAAGAGAFYIAAATDWPQTYLVMAMLVAVGMVTVLLVGEPDVEPSASAAAREQRVIDFLERSDNLPGWLRDAGAWFIGAVVCPFVDFFARYGRLAVAVLVFVAIFRITDITMGVMANPFYLDIGYTKSEIASVAKIFGIGMTILGAAGGGALVMRFGIMRPLLGGAILAAATNLAFAWLATRSDPGLAGLAVTISADNLAGGMAGSAFIAYLSSLTNTRYTATQYALFSSLMTLPGKFVGGFSGVVVEAFGYAQFFIYTAIAGIPAILLAWYLMRQAGADASPDNGT